MRHAQGLADNNGDLQCPTCFFWQHAACVDVDKQSRNYICVFCQRDYGYDNMNADFG